MKKHNLISELLFYAAILAVIVFVLSTLFSGGQDQEKVTYDKVAEYIGGGHVTEITISNKNVLTMKLDDETQVSYKIADLYFFRETFDAQILASDIVYEVEPAASTPWWLNLLPWVIGIVVVIVLYVLFFSLLNGKGGSRFNSFGRARVKTPNLSDRDRVMFRDVAGADEEKEELVEIVQFLKDPEKFTRLGAKIPHGVLLVGPPGTGKTLLAKAVAGEAGVPFYSISGSDFVEMYVGVGASRVRDLFDTARKSPASIIFIDEIDAVGRHRGAGLGGGHDEREQTLNQLLVEMDGFGSHSGIIVMAATNRPDILDPALLRPGRFDRQVTVNYPDLQGREEILRVHARNKPMEESVDFHKIAQSTVGFTGADLANLLNEAALLAAKKDKSLIGMEEIEASIMKALLGPQKKAKMRTEKENRLTAYHEAGHAVVSFYCENTDPVKHITIVPSGRAGGVTVSAPTEDRSYLTRNAMLDDISYALGGRIAEELILDDISTGASSDIQQATKRARDMVTRYGMSETLGTVLYGSEHTSDEIFLGRDYSSGKDYSEETAAEIDREIKRIIGECYGRAKEILSEHIDKLHFVAQYLLGHESMDGDQFEAAMKDGATVEDLEAIAAEKAEKSRRDNELAAQKAAEEAARKAAEAEAAANGAVPEGTMPAEATDEGSSDDESSDDQPTDDQSTDAEASDGEASDGEASDKK